MPALPSSLSASLASRLARFTGGCATSLQRVRPIRLGRRGNVAQGHGDVALVIGANDVTNPAARSEPSSPIYGMPILDVDKAASVIVMKRSMNPGFAGIDNELYLDPRTTMLFGDAKDSVVKLIAAVKAT